MSKNKHKSYLPNLRTDYSSQNKDLISKAPNGDITPIPNPATDPIVANNIATAEFDYTESISSKE